MSSLLGHVIVHGGFLGEYLGLRFEVSALPLPLPPTRAPNFLFFFFTFIAMGRTPYK